MIKYLIMEHKITFIEKFSNPQTFIKMALEIMHTKCYIMFE